MSAPTREAAFALLQQYNSNPSLITHAKAVEATMRYLARRGGQDEDQWGIIGLIHDLDYEQFPEQHCQKTEEILRANGWPEDYIRAVLSHGWGICTDVEPQSLLEKTLARHDGDADPIVRYVTLLCAKQLRDDLFGRYRDFFKTRRNFLNMLSI